jgi:hypothetical protein
MYTLKITFCQLWVIGKLSVLAFPVPTPFSSMLIFFWDSGGRAMVCRRATRALIENAGTRIE